jgi:hypothetical protein
MEEPLMYAIWRFFFSLKGQKHKLYKESKQLPQASKMIKRKLPENNENCWKKDQHSKVLIRTYKYNSLKFNLERTKPNMKYKLPVNTENKIKLWYLGCFQYLHLK